MAFNLKKKQERRKRSQLKVRRKIQGTEEKPRVCVFRSLKNTYVQVISDDSGRTLCSASSRDKEVLQKAETLSFEENANSQASSSKSTKVAKALGMVIADKLNAAKIAKAIFDRNGFKYQGRVKSVAEGIRLAGFNI